MEQVTTDDYQRTVQIHAAFEAEQGCWLWDSSDGQAHRAPWLDGYRLLGLAPAGDRLLLKDTARRNDNLEPSRQNWHSESQLYMADLHDRTIRLLLDWHPDVVIGWSAAWNPSGTQVAIHAADVDDDQESMQVVVLDLGDGTTRRVYQGPGGFSVDDQLAWSPDGSRIAVDVWGGTFDGSWDEIERVLVVDTAGTLLGLQPHFTLYGTPGGGWTENGLLVRSVGDDPGAESGLPFATTVRLPSEHDQTPFAPGDHNNQPVPRLRHGPRTPPSTELGWMNEDGSFGEILCTVPDTNVTNWVTTSAITGSRPVR